MPDDAGIALDSPRAAYDAATQTTRDMVNDPAVARDLTGWVIEIKDENGRTLLTVPFTEATQASGSSRA